MGIYEIFNWIYSLEEETKVNLHETVSDLKGEVFLNKNDNGILFNLGIPNFKLLYKKDSNFIISHDLFEIRIVHFLVKQNGFSSRLCQAYMFESLKFNRAEEKYQCYYSKIESHFLIKDFLKDFSDEINFHFKNIVFKISTCAISPNIKGEFLCIEADQKLTFIEFKHCINNIITSIGFLTANFYKKEEFYFQSELKDFSVETDFFYRNSDEKHSFPCPFTKSTEEWNWKIKVELSNELNVKYSSSIDEKTFSNLVNLLLENPKIYFSIRMIFDFYSYPIISRVSIMFVVLETLCEELNIKTEFAQKEFKKENGFKTLLSIKDQINEFDYKILEDIIENIDNELTNNVVNFEQTFKSLNINISNSDKLIFKQRNHFFHGRIIPERINIDSEEEFNNLEKTYDNYSLQLYVLISKLILKRIDFSGYLINYPKLFEQNNNLNLKEPYFIKL
jgi:hypothetical protein